LSKKYANTIFSRKSIEYAFIQNADIILQVYLITAGSAVLVQNGIKVRAYTLDFGDVGISEYPYAEQVANRLHIPLVKVPYLNHYGILSDRTMIRMMMGILRMK
jgi:hypothetical protein